MNPVVNTVTREFMDDLVDAIMNIANSDFLSEESKPAEIERELVDNLLIYIKEDE